MFGGKAGEGEDVHAALWDFRVNPWIGGCERVSGTGTEGARKTSKEGKGGRF